MDFKMYFGKFVQRGAHVGSLTCLSLYSQLAATLFKRMSSSLKKQEPASINDVPDLKS